MNRIADLGIKLWFVVLGLIVIAWISFNTGKILPGLWENRTPTIIVAPTEIIKMDTPTPVPTIRVNSEPATSATQSTIQTSGKWSDILSVRMPTLNEIRVEKPISLWDANLINLRDRYEPGTENYAGEAQTGSEYLLPIYWCTTTADLLTQNMESIKTIFMVNDEAVPDKYIFNYNYDTKSGWKCNYNAVVLGGWEKDAQYALKVTRTLSQKLSDGKSNYSAGEYVYRLVVKVR
ncbi:hypothetical protein EHM76_03515 [bacterium]|nr:MAG: hypothetical protein EHM76_03515 [bacterium]